MIKYSTYMKLNICFTGQSCLINMIPLQTFPYSGTYQCFTIDFFNHIFWVKNKKIITQEKSKRLLKFYSKFKI